MAIPSSMAITSAKQPSGYSICHNHITSAVTHVVSIFHMVKTSAYNNMAITSAMLAITSAIYKWPTICHNTTDY